MKGYYQKRIKSLETALEKALNEVKAERSARDEAVRYIYVLLKLMGGHAIVHTRDLQRQKGRVMCNVSRGTGIVRMHIDYDFVGKGTKKCLRNTENLIPMRRSTARRPRRDHPRLRGEYSSCRSFAILSLGSPPLARGILPFSYADDMPPGITPACAGNTDPRGKLSRPS